MRKIFLAGAIFGTVAPYAFFIQFLVDDGLEIASFVQQMFGAPIAAFFVMDVLVSALMLWAFIFSEGRRFQMKNLWVYVLCTLLVGVSLALPLFSTSAKGSWNH